MFDKFQYARIEDIKKRAKYLQRLLGRQNIRLTYVHSITVFIFGFHDWNHYLLSIESGIKLNATFDEDLLSSDLASRQAFQTDRLAEALRVDKGLAMELLEQWKPSSRLPRPKIQDLDGKFGQKYFENREAQSDLPDRAAKETSRAKLVGATESTAEASDIIHATGTESAKITYKRKRICAAPSVI